MENLHAYDKHNRMTSAFPEYRILIHYKTSDCASHMTGAFFTWKFKYSSWMTSSDFQTPRGVETAK